MQKQSINNHITSKVETAGQLLPVSAAFSQPSVSVPKVPHAEAGSCDVTAAADTDRALRRRLKPRHEKSASCDICPASNTGPQRCSFNATLPFSPREHVAHSA